MQCYVTSAIDVVLNNLQINKLLNTVWEQNIELLNIKFEGNIQCPI